MNKLQALRAKKAEVKKVVLRRLQNVNPLLFERHGLGVVKREIFQARLEFGIQRNYLTKKWVVIHRERGILEI